MSPNSAVVSVAVSAVVSVAVSAVVSVALSRWLMWRPHGKKIGQRSFLRGVCTLSLSRVSKQVSVVGCLFGLAL